MPKNIKKKIVIIGPVYPYRGGNSLFVSYVYDALIKEFDVIIYNYKLLYPSFLFPGTSQYDKSKSVIKKAPGKRIVNSINPFNWISTASKLKKEKADLVVFDWWHPFFGFCHFSISALIKKEYKKKILFITENVISHEGNFIDKFLTKIGLKNASSFLVLSDKVEKELTPLKKERKIYKSELPVYDCYNPEPSENNFKEKLGLKNSDKVLLFFGYVRKYKGLDLLIEAFPLVKEEITDLKLLIVGEFYENPEFYYKKINELGLEKDLIVINKFVSNEEVHQYYAAADLVVLPYRSATQSGILNVAYGFSKPVLVTNVGGLAEFVKNEETGIIIDNPDPLTIAQGIKKFFRLHSKVDFSSNINSIINNNKFKKLPELFSKIIEDTSK